MKNVDAPNNFISTVSNWYTYSNDKGAEWAFLGKET